MQFTNMQHHAVHVVQAFRKLYKRAKAGEIMSEGSLDAAQTLALNERHGLRSKAELFYAALVRYSKILPNAKRLPENFGMYKESEHKQYLDPSNRYWTEA